MGPAFLIKLLQDKLGVSENCTGRTFPSLGLQLKAQDGKVHDLTLAPEDYMDRESSNGTEYCWAHLLPMEDPGKGPVLVLGMPFLRKYYTVFDFGNSALGFAVAKQPATSPPVPPNAHETDGASVLGGGRSAASEPALSDEPLTKRGGLPSRRNGTLPLLACRGDCFGGKAGAAPAPEDPSVTPPLPADATLEPSAGASLPIARIERKPPAHATASKVSAGLG